MTSSADYIPKVKAEHDAVDAGEGSMLTHAIACGKLLATVEHILEEENATKTRKKDHVSLNGWAKQNCGIAQTTVSLYKRLWDNEAEIKKQGCKTIGEAKKEIPKDPDKVRLADERRQLRERQKQQDQEQAAEQTVAHVVTAFTPQEMFSELIALWGDDKSDNRKLRELNKLLTAHLSTAHASQPAVASTRSPPPNELARRA
jgi:hypothetical protein